jgi:glutamine---fructose-6-phosphate transaminase (isomerizing)
MTSDPRQETVDMSHAEPSSLGRITTQEIDSQPDCWETAARMAAAGVRGLPQAGEHVLVLGCGTSYYVAAAYAWLREQQGHGVTDAVVASELTRTTRTYDRVVAISRSGTTTEVVNALGLFASGTPVTAVLGELGTPVGDLASDIVDVSFADERSVVQTRFPTTLLTLLRADLGLPGPELASLVADARRVLAATVYEPAPRQLVVLGRGWAAALAQEGALKCRESAGMWAEAYATGEYRHGPISVAGPGTLVWALTPMTSLETAAIEATGARLRQAAGDPQVELVAVQRHAVAWAVSAGRDADLPRHLSRSVTTV